MGSIIIRNAKVILPFEGVSNASVFIDGGRIAELAQRDEKSAADQMIDAADLTIYPGFIDLHIHGAVGIDVNTADTDGLIEIARFLASNGVTSWVPTLVPDSDENYRKVISAIDRLIEIQTGEAIAQAVGVHYEGVFANEKMCGALRPEFFRSGQWAVGGGRLPMLKTGIHMTTLAPEVEGGIELTRSLVEQGWIVSIGHTRADIVTLDAAFAAGARHMTHFFNAMTGLHHREVGVAGWGLGHSDVTFDIIADGVHVHPKMLEFACRSKGADKVIADQRFGRSDRIGRR